jgi:restriction system protein
MVPDYQSLMLPLLKLLADNKVHSIHELIDILSNKFKLTEEDRNALLPSGIQRIINNRVGWARTYMKKSGLVNAPKRGFQATSLLASLELAFSSNQSVSRLAIVSIKSPTLR